MEREKPNFDILGRIDRERLARGWSEYTLAENSGLTPRLKKFVTALASPSHSFLKRTLPFII